MQTIRMFQTCLSVSFYMSPQERNATKDTSGLWYSSCAGVVTVFGLLPEQIAAEDYTEHEDEHANAQYDDVHVERQTVDVFL